MVWVFIMYFSLGIDRFNISSALSDNMLGDLKMNTNDYNLGTTLNRVRSETSYFVQRAHCVCIQICFLVAELPMQLISKRVGKCRRRLTQSTFAYTYLQGRTAGFLLRFAMLLCNLHFQAVDILFADDLLERYLVRPILAQRQNVILGDQVSFFPFASWVTTTHLAVELSSASCKAASYPTSSCTCHTTTPGPNFPSAWLGFTFRTTCRWWSAHSLRLVFCVCGLPTGWKDGGTCSSSRAY